MTDYERLRSTFGTLGIPLIENNYTLRNYDCIGFDTSAYPGIFQVNQDGLAYTVEVTFCFDRTTQAFSHVELIGD